jgi:tetratricopeptide (TPR) repeat protein
MSSALTEDQTEALYRHAKAFARREQFDRAIEKCREILAASPAHGPTLALLGEALLGQGSWSEAAAALAQAHDALPDDNLVFFLLGFAHQLEGNYEPAIAVFHALLEKGWNQPRVHFHLGGCLLASGHADEALPELKLAAVGSEHLGHNFLLALTQTMAGNFAEACEAFARARSPAAPPKEPAALKRLERHAADAERYRAQNSSSPPAPAKFLNDSIDWAAVRREFESRPQRYVVVDDFLDETALAWINDFVHRGEWVAGTTSGDEIHASLADGFFAVPLLQLAQAFAREGGGIVGKLPFQSLWFYKYFRNNRERTPHADAGRISCNIWITPDSHNRRRDMGGLRLWSVPAERNYYGRDRAWQRDYVLQRLAGQDGNSEIIPYRCNRAVIFDSRLIHQTEEFDFDESHTGRRANITIAYGSHHSRID